MPGDFAQQMKPAAHPAAAQSPQWSHAIPMHGGGTPAPPQHCVPAGAPAGGHAGGGGGFASGGGGVASGGGMDASGGGGGASGLGFELSVSTRPSLVAIASDAAETSALASFDGSPAPDELEAGGPGDVVPTGSGALPSGSFSTGASSGVETHAMAQTIGNAMTETRSAARAVREEDCERARMTATLAFRARCAKAARRFRRSAVP